MLKRFTFYLTAMERLLVSISLFLLFAFTLIQVIARNFFETGFPSLDIISRHLVLYIAFLGAALITAEQKHIKIDFLQHFLTETQKKFLVRPLSLVAAFICATFTWHAARFWLNEWQYSTVQDGWIVVLALILPIGFGLLTLHFMVLAVSADIEPVSDTPCT